MITDSEVITLNESLMIQEKGKTVKYLALIDIIFSCIRIFLSPLFAIAAFISLIFGLTGYNGAKKYNKCSTKTYIYYLVLQNIFQIVILGFYIFKPSILNIDHTYETTGIFNCILVLINCYITYFIYLFYNLISQHSQFALTNLNRPESIFIIDGEIV